MSRDLRILVQDTKDRNACRTMLNVDKDYNLYKEIEKLDYMHFENITFYFSNIEKIITKDEYSEKIRGIKAKEFKKINSFNLSDKNKNILNFICNLNPDIYIFLYYY